MKKSFFLFVVFALCITALSLLSGFSFILFNVCQRFSAGMLFDFFNVFVFLKGVAVGLPFTAIFSCLFVILYAIRQTSNIWMNFIIYFLLCALTWCFIIPYSYKLCNFAQEETAKIPYVSNNNYISENYFRKSEKGTVYFNRIDEDSLLSDGIIINKGNVETFENESVLNFFEADKKTKNIEDPLFTSTIKPAGFMNQFFKFANFFLEYLNESYLLKGIYLISLISFALALFSAIAFSQYSKWRLCNVCIVIASFLFCLLVNYALYVSKTADLILNFFLNKKVTFLGNRQMVQIIINSLFVSVAAVVGTIKLITNRRANAEPTEEEMAQMEGFSDFDEDENPEA